MKRIGRLGRVKVTADGRGLKSHSGVELLRELAGSTGLIDSWDRVLLGTYRGVPFHYPGTVLADVAVGIADGATSISGLRAQRDGIPVSGPVASTPTVWRVLDRVTDTGLAGLRAGRGEARAAAWAAGAGPDLGGELFLDFDATIVTAHSEKELATPTWKKTFGLHPLLCVLDRPEIAAGEALAGVLREGRAGSNTTADHVEVLGLALENLPAHARPGPGGPRLIARADAAGATHGFAKACRDRRVGISFGFPITQPVRDAITATPGGAWVDAIDDDDSEEPREGAWVTEITDLIDLSPWPQGSRVIVRKERPHPGASMSLFDTINGLRHTAFITTEPAEDERSVLKLAELELRHRRHARIEDRIRQFKAAGLRNLPCRAAAENRAWLECVLAAADLVAWSKLVCFADNPEIARAEINLFRYKILHTAARVVNTGRTINLRLDQGWAWAKALALAFTRMRTAFA